MSRVVLHIGAHKTGTTMLQRSFFPALPDCVLLTHGGRTSDSITKILSYSLMHDEDFDAHTFGAFVREHHRKAGTVLVSHEGFAGDPFDRASNRLRILDRLQAATPEASVLIGIREQSSMLRSLYNQHIVRGGSESVDELLDDGHFLDYLRYDEWIEAAVERFGDGAVTVLPYERLRADRRGFLDAVARTVLGTDEPVEQIEEPAVQNASLSPASRAVLRWANRNVRATSLNPRPRLGRLPNADAIFFLLQRRIDPLLFAGTDRSLAPGAEALLRSTAAMFGSVNRRVEELTGLSLAEYGYVVGDEVAP